MVKLAETWIFVYGVEREKEGGKVLTKTINN